MIRPWFPPCLRTRELIIGVSDRDTKVERRIDPATTIANSLNKRPVSPCKKKMGRNTQIRLTDVEMTAKKTSLLPLKAACTGFIPFSTLE